MHNLETAIWNHKSIQKIFFESCSTNQKLSIWTLIDEVLLAVMEKNELKYYGKSKQKTFLKINRTISILKHGANVLIFLSSILVSNRSCRLRRWRDKSTRLLRRNMEKKEVRSIIFLKTFLH